MDVGRKLVETFKLNENVRITEEIANVSKLSNRVIKNAFITFSFEFLPKNDADVGKRIESGFPKMYHTYLKF